ncbi:MAG: glycosyltransferase family 4 protein [Pontiella sp.]
MLKICIWMNIPSHYQSAFFDALDSRHDVDLRVVYFRGISQDRAAEGWSGEHAYKSFESVVDDGTSPEGMVKTVSDWEHRVHIISGYFSSKLIDYFCKNKIRWCHWSEMSGVRLAELLKYNMSLFRLLNPLVLYAKRTEGLRIRKYAVGAFGQGDLARRSFRLMGVPDSKIDDLFYVPAALAETTPSIQVVEFAAGRKVFLSVGALCKRKGIDVLLKAFARQNASDWCVVLCGLDRADRIYQALAKKLGIEKQVLFLGAYPSKRINEVYSGADVFVLPSRFDGWGAVENEAASLGLPIIGTDLCGASMHVIVEGINGFRVKAGNVASLANALKAYIQTPPRIVAHGQASRDRFYECFTPGHNAERFVESLAAWSCR